MKFLARPTLRPILSVIDCEGLRGRRTGGSMCGGRRILLGCFKAQPGNVGPFITASLIHEDLMHYRLFRERRIKDASFVLEETGKRV